MELEVTNRGFALGKFNDSNGLTCSIQISSSMGYSDEEGGEGNYIWLGIQNTHPMYLFPYLGWKEVEYAEGIDKKEVLLHGRMHLSQVKVKELLPLLQHFAEHGELPY